MPSMIRTSKSKTTLSSVPSLSTMSEKLGTGSEYDEAVSVVSGDAGVEVTRRRDRSRRSKFLSSSLKPMRPRLVKGSAAKKELSPELRAPEVVFDHCNVRQRKAGDIRIYDINQRSHDTADYFIPAQVHDLKNELTPVKTNETPTHNHLLELMQSHETSSTIARDFALPQNIHRPRHKQVYYFAGGGFQASPSDHHWRFCAELAHRMTKESDQPTTVSIVSHPLAPLHTIDAAFGALEKFYDWVLPSSPPSSPRLSPLRPKEDSPSRNGSPVSLGPRKSPTRYLKPDDDIIFAGDSSGGNIALSLVLHMLAKNPHAPTPSQILLVSPVVDLTHDNPEQLEITKRDPLMTIDHVREVARAWCGGDTSPSDPRASPLYGDLGELAARNILLHAVVAGDDVLAPDALRLLDKCRQHGIRGRWLVWERMMHAFPLAPHYGMPESREAMDWVLGVLSAKKAAA